MASPNLLAGNLFRLNRSAGGTPEVFNFVCSATTRGVTKTSQFEDATVPDCDSPTAIPWRKSVKRSKEWSMPFSGICDAGRFRQIDQDFDSDTPVRYQIQIDKPLALGGGAYTGAIFFESLSVTSDNGGMVRFTATARGDDPLVWADAAA